MYLTVNVPIRQIPEDKHEELMNKIEDVCSEYGAVVEPTIAEEDE